MSEPLKVLIVEDTPSDADLLVLHLTREGYMVDWDRVEDEDEFLAALNKKYDLVISDWVLPHFSGERAFKLFAEYGSEIPFIIVSGGIGEETAVAVMRQGAADYLLKDRLERLGQAVRHALEKKKLQVDRKRNEDLLRVQSAALNATANAIIITDRNGMIEWANPAFSILTGYPIQEAVGHNPRSLIKSGLHDKKFYQKMWSEILTGNVWNGEVINRRKDCTLYNEEMTITPMLDAEGKTIHFIAVKQDISERKKADEALKKSSHDLEMAYDATLQGWSNALELREHETAGHSQRVVQMTLELSRKLGVKEEALIHIQRGALLHDIGKMGIPDSVLLKPEPLSDEEWDIMKKHPVYAYQLLSKIPYLEPALDIPYCHHEKWDGSGYPRGLKGENIPLAARIFSIVDVWDALSYDRPYRAAWTQKEIIHHLKDQSGKQFDPQVVEAFGNLWQ